jgi:hypothetical protein
MTMTRLLMAITIQALLLAVVPAQAAERKEPTYAYGRTVTLAGTLRSKTIKDRNGDAYTYDSVILSEAITVTGNGEPETGVRVSMLILDAKTIPAFRSNKDLRVVMTGVLSPADAHPLNAKRKFTRVLFAPTSFSR